MSTFRTWDGEGIGDKYTLLANSDGERIQDWDNGLSTEMCINFLTKRRKGRAKRNAWFSFGYDVNMMMADLLPHQLRELCDEREEHNGRPKKATTTTWQNRELAYIPGKILRIKRDAKHSVTHDDCFGFFQTSFIKAVEGILGKGRVSQLVRDGKAAREGFAGWSRDNIIAYNDEECQLLKESLEVLDGAFQALPVPIELHAWYGPGAAANQFLTKLDVRSQCNPALLHPWVKSAANFAYFGGRIELFQRGGYPGEIYHADINSAYPAAACWLPDLSDPLGRWEQTGGPDSPTEFGVYEVEWDLGPAWDPPGPIGPFPLRCRNGSIIYPMKGTGYYWAPEVFEAQRVWGDRIKIIDGCRLIPGSPDPYPLRAWIRDFYVRRQEYKAADNILHYPIKLLLNSLYGKFAQSIGRPRFANLAWAGFITSYCRAKMLAAMMQAPDQIIGAATDGVYSKVPLQLPSSSALGEWDTTTHLEGQFIMSGVYRLKDTCPACDGAGHVRTAGHPCFAPPCNKCKGAGVIWTERTRSFNDSQLQTLVDQLHHTRVISITNRRFVGMRLALAQPGRFGPLWRTFTEVEKVINLASDVDTKRVYEGDEGGSFHLGRLTPSIPVPNPNRDGWSARYSPPTPSRYMYETDGEMTKEMEAVLLARAEDEVGE